METLMAEIRALGHLPRLTPGLGEEYTLRVRLENAKRASLLTDSQLAELADMEREDTLMAEIQACGSLSESQLAELADMERRAEEVVGLPGAAAYSETVMAEIRALGRLPHLWDGLGGEYALAGRLRAAKRQRILSDSELGELVEIERKAAEQRAAEHVDTPDGRHPSTRPG